MEVLPLLDLPVSDTVRQESVVFPLRSFFDPHFEALPSPHFSPSSNHVIIVSILFPHYQYLLPLLPQLRSLSPFVSYLALIAVLSPFPQRTIVRQFKTQSPPARSFPIHLYYNRRPRFTVPVSLYGVQKYTWSSSWIILVELEAGIEILIA